jgi:hypothetical protein
MKELRCDKPMATAACSATYMDLRNDVRHLVHWQVALARKHYEYAPPPPTPPSHLKRTLSNRAVLQIRKAARNPSRPHPLVEER